MDEWCPVRGCPCGVGTFSDVPTFSAEWHRRHLAKHSEAFDVDERTLSVLSELVAHAEAKESQEMSGQSTQVVGIINT